MNKAVILLLQWDNWCVKFLQNKNKFTINSNSVSPKKTVFYTIKYLRILLHFIVFLSIKKVIVFFLNRVVADTYDLCRSFKAKSQARKIYQVLSKKQPANVNGRGSRVGGGLLIVHCKITENMPQNHLPYPGNWISLEPPPPGKQILDPHMCI